jgi:hypothetical protein
MVKRINHILYFLRFETPADGVSKSDREGPFINNFPEISPSTLFGLVGGNNATTSGSFGAPYCKPGSGPIRRYCSVTDVR